MEQWFLDKLNKIAKYNDYPKGYLTVKQCDTIHKWTPADLVAREYLNNGCGSARGFLGISCDTCEKCYRYMCEIKEELIAQDLISEKAVNNSGFPLWSNYEFDI